jgi:hypothetical protein
MHVDNDIDVDIDRGALGGKEKEKFDCKQISCIEKVYHKAAWHYWFS